MARAGNTRVGVRGVPLREQVANADREARMEVSVRRKCWRVAGGQGRGIGDGGMDG